MNLVSLQHQFAHDVALLIQAAEKMGYEISMAEAYRTPEQALLNAQHGTGIVHSLHTLRLAIDLNIFRNGLWMKDGGFDDLGEFWKALSPVHFWGGDFKSRDFNHFSLSPDGITK